MDKILLLEEQTRNIILNLYISCEKYFIQALIIFENIYESKDYTISELRKENLLKIEQITPVPINYKDSLTITPPFSPSISSISPTDIQVSNYHKNPNTFEYFKNKTDTNNFTSLSRSDNSLSTDPVFAPKEPAPTFAPAPAPTFTPTPTPTFAPAPAPSQSDPVSSIFSPEPDPAFTPAPEAAPSSEPVPAFTPAPATSDPVTAFTPAPAPSEPVPAFTPGPESAPSSEPAPAFTPAPEPSPAFTPAPETAPSSEPSTAFTPTEPKPQVDVYQPLAPTKEQIMGFPRETNKDYSLVEPTNGLQKPQYLAQSLPKTNTNVGLSFPGKSTNATTQIEPLTTPTPQVSEQYSNKYRNQLKLPPT